ncbi:hypothetical protein CW751_00975 [Brumimicrobium salinarum]|uniref:Uncharacterized protein n=1 Tax=Brumimicrobium salinarum TaxID=2058658 RepID=A0A2I0R6F8_9FLAO|nr:hypothetical protein [Brumimicrobium salinarum]PKR81940.1 hypothetical protein CW751_00975 [Brumimicrobium salinarum]
MNYKHLIFALIIGGVVSCDKDKNEPLPEENSGPKLIFRMKMDPNQERLDGFGNPATIPAGHAAQTPDFNSISAHYIELAPSAYTQVGDGEVIYHGAETTEGGDNAVIFDKLKKVAHGETVFSKPLSQITPGNYNWARVSVTYQNYDVDFRANGYDLKGTIASFVGFNTYITSHKVKTKTVNVNANKLQGYWAWETPAIGSFYPATVVQGQAPGTTVPNPLAQSSPIPTGSCLVTGGFETPFTVTGNESEDIIIDLSFSVNNSFEWSDAAGNDIYEPLDGDTVVDMGLRGLIPIVVQ